MKGFLLAVILAVIILGLGFGASGQTCGFVVNSCAPEKGKERGR